MSSCCAKHAWKDPLSVARRNDFLTMQGHFTGDQSRGDSESAITTSLGVVVRVPRHSCGLGGCAKHQTPGRLDEDGWEPGARDLASIVTVIEAAATARISGRSTPTGAPSWWTSSRAGFVHGPPTSARAVSLSGTV